MIVLYHIFRQKSVDSTDDLKMMANKKAAGEKLIEIEKAETGSVSVYNFFFFFNLIVDINFDEYKIIFIQTSK